MVVIRLKKEWIFIGFLVFLQFFYIIAQGEKKSANATEDVGRLACAYMADIDAGELDKQMTYWSDDPAATSVIMGEIWTGKPNIRKRSAEYLPFAKIMRNQLGQIKSLLLGTEYILTIIPYRSMRRNPADEKLKPYELDSMLTLIWQKTPKGWHIIHEHVSVKVPPPGQG